MSKQHWLAAICCCLAVQVQAANRPQMPQPPFPYQSVAVEFDNPKAAGVHLAGTLTVPAGKGPFPAVLLITGSGPQDRDETILEHKPFAVLADYLARRGIASLRVDDRGVGQSTGQPTYMATTNELATDAAAALAVLKNHPEILPGKVGVLGHSEGGTIAAMLATDPANGVALLVSLAGPGLPGAQIVETQVEAIAQLAGLPEAQIQAQVQQQKLLHQWLLAYPVNSHEAFGQLCDELDRIMPGRNIVQTRSMANNLTTPWQQQFLRLDPRDYWRQIKVPALVLNGSKDSQVLAEPNLAAIRQALLAAGNTRAELRELAGLNHLFQRAQTGALGEYALIEETLAPEVLQIIGDWLVGVLAGQ